MAAHLERDPGLIESLCPTNEAMWGLASLSLTPKGRRKIAELAGTDVLAPEGFITREALIEAMRIILKRDGVHKTLQALKRLVQRGFEVAKESGASMSPFIGTSLKRPPELKVDDWDRYAEEVAAEQIASRTVFLEDDLGPQLLAVKSGARGQLRQLNWLFDVRGVATDVHGRSVVIRHGYRDGLTPAEMYTAVLGAGEG